ncbi:MAG: B12-binding domain-containing protein [Candidatus Freyarchaeota archaeon]
MSEVLSKIAKSIEDLDGKEAEKLVRKALDEGVDPVKILEDGIIAGVRAVGEKFEKKEYFLAELYEGGEIAEKLVEIVGPRIPKEAGGARKRVVIGTVHGDLHDIGKNLVAMQLTMAGFEVRDLGIDVPAMRFIEEAESFKADIIAMSSLLMATMMNMAEVVNLLKELGLRDKYKVLVGGGPINPVLAQMFGADGYAENAVEAVKVAKKLVGLGGA